MSPINCDENKQQKAPKGTNSILVHSTSIAINWNKLVFGTNLEPTKSAKKKALRKRLKL